MPRGRGDLSAVPERQRDLDMATTLLQLLQPGVEQGLMQAAPADLLPLYVFGAWFAVIFFVGGWILVRR